MSKIAIAPDTYVALRFIVGDQAFDLDFAPRHVQTATLVHGVDRAQCTFFLRVCAAHRAAVASKRVGARLRRGVPCRAG